MSIYNCPVFNCENAYTSLKMLELHGKSDHPQEYQVNRDIFQEKTNKKICTMCLFPYIKIAEHQQFCKDKNKFRETIYKCPNDNCLYETKCKSGMTRHKCINYIKKDSKTSKVRTPKTPRTPKVRAPRTKIPKPNKLTIQGIIDFNLEIDYRRMCLFCHSFFHNEAYAKKHMDNMLCLKAEEKKILN